MLQLIPLLGLLVTVTVAPTFLQGSRDPPMRESQPPYKGVAPPLDFKFGVGRAGDTADPAGGASGDRDRRAHISPRES